MEITNLTIRIVLLAMPGLICYYITKKLTEPREENYLSILTEIITYSFISYSMLSLGKVILSNFININKDVKFLECLLNPNLPINWGEIIFTSFLAIIIACILARCFNKSIFYEIARFLKLTKKYGDIDVWTYLFNSSDNFYIVIRDIENNLMYQGYPNVFSKGHRDAEILLKDVNVYKCNNGKFLFKADSMYYKFDNNKIVLEIQPIKEEYKNDKNSGN